MASKVKNSETYQDDKTWTKKRLGLIIAVAIVYGLWFNLLDTVAFCEFSVKDSKVNCNSIGQIFGGNSLYQAWNIVGHSLPGLFMLFGFKEHRLELFLAGFLLSTVVMDSPLWGIERKVFHGLSLWDGVEDTTASNPEHCPVKHSITYSIKDWINYYYNPLGFYLVWDCSWLFPNFPTAAAIFWSLVGRIVAAVLLIWYQEKIESRGQYFSLKKTVFRM
jgi:hypothetical protein